MTPRVIYLIVLWCLTQSLPALAGYPIYLVDRFDDEPSATACTAAPGDCSLRGALLTAAADGGTSDVRLAAGTYQLTVAGAGEDLGQTGDLDVLAEDLILRGEGVDATVIDASVLADRAMDIPFAAGLQVEIEGLTIRGGAVDAPGGGIRTRSRLVLRDAAVRDCSATRGGGLSSGVELVVERSTIAGNTATMDGGGIAVTGAVTVEASTLADNHADGAGGGLDVAGISSGVDLLNSTLSGNHAGSGSALHVVGGSLSVDFSTVVAPADEPSPAVLEDGLGFVNFTSSAVLGDCLGNGFNSFGGNLESPGDSCGFVTGSDQTGVAEPRLSALGDWGGPTLTHRPYPDSPMLEAGVAGTCPATDQRGVGRPIDGDGGGDPACDTGAHEAEQAFQVELVVDRTDDDPAATTCADGPGDCSLRGAILTANALAGLDVVVVPAGRFVLTAGGGDELGGDLDVLESLTLEGAGAEHTILDAAGADDRVLQLGPGVHLYLNGVTVQGGSATDGGGIDAGFGSLSAHSCVIRDNLASGDGGGIRALGDVTLQGSAVIGNRATDGGGLWVAASTALTESTVSGNQAAGAGGAIFNDGTVGIAGLSLEDVTVAFNTAPAGSAIATSGGGDLQLAGSLIEGACTAAGFSLGGNLESPGDTCGLTEADDQAAVADPMLAPLSSLLGYPPAHRPLPGSPAVDAYFCLSGADQQGYPRPLDGDGAGPSLCDAGAREAPRRLTVTTTDDHDDGTCDAADCTLREAVRATNADATPSANGLDEIVVPAGLYFFSLAGSGEDDGATGDLDVRDSLVVIGDPAGGTLVDALGGDRVFDLPTFDPVTLVLVDVAVQGGSADLGGGIQAHGDGTLWLERSSVAYCTASSVGGGVYSNGVVLLRRSTVVGNEAGQSGGGVFLAAAQALSAAGSTLSSNHALAGSGGAVASTGSALLEITGATFSGNTSATGGGTLMPSVGDSVTLTNTLLDGDCGGQGNADYRSLGGNLESPGNSCGFDRPDDLVAVPDPGLGPLAPNGGPTPTHALLAGSPALDAGRDAGALPFDQRGEPRPADGDNDGVARTDIGAVEMPGPGIFADDFESGDLGAWSGHT